MYTVLIMISRPRAMRMQNVIFATKTKSNRIIIKFVQDESNELSPVVNKDEKSPMKLGQRRVQLGEPIWQDVWTPFHVYAISAGVKNGKNTV